MKRMGFYVNCLSAEIHTDPFLHRAGDVRIPVATVWHVACVCLYVYMCAASVCLFICSAKANLGEEKHKYILVHMLVIRALAIEYDAEALIMDVSSSWKGGKALIYTHRFPGIFIGLAKCHYTAGGEVMNCNKL